MSFGVTLRMQSVRWNLWSGNSRRCRIPATLLASLLFFHGSVATAEEAGAIDRPAKTAELPPEERAAYDAQVRPFLKKYCFACHGETGAVRLDNLGTDFSKTAADWKEIRNKLYERAMPPKKHKGKIPLQPGDKETIDVAEWIGNQLIRAERDARLAGGKVLLRRMNRDEYANTIVDLFHLDEPVAAQIAAALPADGTVDGFDKIGTGLLFDRALLRKYLDAADWIAARVIVSGDKPQPKVMRYDALASTAHPPEISVGGWRGLLSQGNKIIYEACGKKPFPYGPAGYSIKKNGVEISCITYLGPLAVNTNHPVFLTNASFPYAVPEDGYYRFRFVGAANKGIRTEPLQIHVEVGRNTVFGMKIDDRLTLTIDGPPDELREYDKLVYLRKPQANEQVHCDLSCKGLLSDLVIVNPEYGKLNGNLNNIIFAIQAAHDKKRPDEEIEKLNRKLAAAAQEMKDFAGSVWIYNPKYDLAQVPRLLYSYFEVEGPIVSEWPPAAQKAILFDGDQRHDEAYVREIFQRFLPRAYRRPPTKDEVELVTAAVMTSMEKYQFTFPEAIRFGIKSVLCSPAFLYIHEPTTSNAPRPLTDDELATRLSYFLWSSMPDAELFDVANQGKLRNPAILKAEVARMIRDPKSRRFTTSFAGQWLQVRDFGSVVPDPRAYRAYDEALEVASKEEVFAFFGHVLEENLPVLNFLDSDFVIINERLATHYGIEGVTGEEFRKVELKPEYHRGGVLGMAGLLTLLSDGTRTLPVRRGAWVSDHLFNDPPKPPPPNAGAVQPSTAGARTLRERLQMHRNEATCASCHIKIDPLGLALENYDAIGRFRVKSTGESYGDKGPPIDASGQLPRTSRLTSNQKFDDLAGYKLALLAEKDSFARALTEKMLTYALGRPVGLLDKAAVDEIQQKLKADNYRIQTLLLAIAESNVFQTK